MIAARGKSGNRERGDLAELPALFRGMGVPSLAHRNAVAADAAKGPQETNADRNELAREQRGEEEKARNAKTAGGKRAGTTNGFGQALLNEMRKPH